MKYAHLVWAALLRRKLRTILTLLSVVISFLLFGILDAVRDTFAHAGQTVAGRYRLLVTPKTGMATKPLPYGLLGKIMQVPGVAEVEYASFVAGTYQNPKNSIVVEGHADTFYDIYPEIYVAPEELAALRRTRTGVLPAEGAAKRYGWKVGDKIAVQTQQARMDGSTTWTFDVVGTLHFLDPNMKVYDQELYCNWDYIEEARAADKGTVAWYALKVSNISGLDLVARQIDALTANSDHETKTQSENAWATAVFQQFGDMGLIVTSIMGAVFFTLLLLTGHTMMQSVHERLPEIGVLKTIGFTGRRTLSLVLSESVTLLLLGVVMGLAVATAAVVWVRAAEVLPIRISSVGEKIWLYGLALGVAAGFLVGVVPALLGMRLQIVDALAGGARRATGRVLPTLGFALAMLLTVVFSLVLLTAFSWWLLLICVALLAAWILSTQAGRQTWSAAKVGVATIPQRLGSSAVVVVGIAGVVGVLVAILSMAAGFERTLQQTGSDDTAIVLQAGSRTETASQLNQDTVAVASQAPQVLRDGTNQPVASPEQLITILLPKKGTGLEASVAMRGVGGYAWDVWPHVRIIAGRNFKPGLRELVAGQGAEQKFAGLDVGSTVAIDGQSWKVVGVFDSGDAHNSEIWGDTRVMGSAYHREGIVNSLTVRLTDARALDALRTSLENDPRLKIEVQTTREYFNQQSQTVARMIRIVGMTIGLIMAVGAIFGALNSTYAAIAARSRELAIFRAIGFRRVPLIFSVLLETMTLAALGGALGAAAAWGIFDGFTAATMGNTGQIVFAFQVSPALVSNGLKWALAIGFIGGLFPAVRAVRVAITTGLRET